MEASHVLVVHSDPALRRVAAGAIGRNGVRISFAASDDEGLLLLEQQRVHVLVTGWDLYGLGNEFVRRAATIQPLLGVVLIGDASRIGHLAQRGSSGPVQYLAKPVTEESLRLAIQRALQRQTRPESSARPATEVAPTADDRRPDATGKCSPIVAVSKAMREITEVSRRAALTDAPVLIQGEPDTGKETIAREIHRQSRRSAGPFVRVACGTLRETDLAERLFGSGESSREDKGHPSRTLFEKAHQGTLFLDNVADLPPWAQAMLLEGLQQRRCVCPGSNREVALDVRVIASSETDLHAAAARRAFSSSLYYYLNIIQIVVPPLRHRPQDIRPLVEMYLAMANAMRANQAVGPPCRFSEDALACLSEYEWPGNILQLASVVAHTVLLADREEIGRASITEALGEVTPPSDSDTIAVPLVGGLKEMERAIIEAVIERCRGNKAAAARALRLHRRTLYRMLQDEPAAKNSGAPLPYIESPSVSNSAAGLLC